MQSERGGSAPDGATFAQALDDLKRNGSNVLLVGAEATRAHTAVCRRLAGESSPHYRLVVGASDPICTAESEFTCEDDGGRDTRVIEHPAWSRDDAPTGEPGESIGELGTAVIEAINEFETEAGGLDASELRVCIDSVVPLLESHSTESVFRLLHMTTSRIRQVRGMGHVHLPLETDHDAVNLFEPLFDAVVEVRTGVDVPEQRWHLRSKGTTSEWVEI